MKAQFLSFLTSLTFVQVQTFVIRCERQSCCRPPSFVKRRHSLLAASAEEALDDDTLNDNSDADDGSVFEAVELPDDRETPLSESELQDLTVAQLKQQLRLRRLVVTGKKQDLVQRLVIASGGTLESSFLGDDVYEFLSDDDRDLSTKTINLLGSQDDDDANPASSNPEVWGADARIVTEYVAPGVVLDSMTRTLVEFTGSNGTQVQAIVAASRDALQPFLRGSNNTKTPSSNAEARLKQIQVQREQAARQSTRGLEEGLSNEGDEQGLYEHVLDREYSDWGKYTVTGASLSAQEVQGVLLLSEEGFGQDILALADKIAFECQPVVVMVPDLFRGQPWIESNDDDNKDNSEEQLTYEQWRAMHSDQRISVDIRAAAACLRERYAVSSVVVWGTGFGGGRALEAASGWLPMDNIHDVNGMIGPPPVDPMVAVAWYPTEYIVNELFGKQHNGRSLDVQGKERKVAVMAVFAGNDTLNGAKAEDAALLKSLLDEDDRVHDLMVKVFRGQDHGFAHRGLSVHDEPDDFERFVDDEFGGSGRVSMGGGDAEVACLLSTAFMETYSRVFLPTVGPPICLDENEKEWSSKLEMMDLTAANNRNIRQEIEDEVANYVESPFDENTADTLENFRKRG
jgi:hypothetical protein